MAITTLRDTYKGDEVYVRSSAPAETLADRGRLLSYVTPFIPESVCDAVARIASHANSVGFDQMAIMLQRRIQPESKGHLSNERRVSRSGAEWLLEEHWPDHRSKRLRPVSEALDESIPLIQATLGQLPADALNPLASSLTLEDVRYHVEWVADSEAVWIVQCDPEHSVSKPGPCNAWMNQRSPQGSKALRTLRPASSAEDSEFKKAQHVRLFRSLNLPFGEVHLLDRSDVVNGLANGKVDADLRSDLEELCEWPVVVRTDSSAGDLFLPHSDALHDVESVLAYLVSTARTLTQTSRGEFAFLLHRFVAARSGAFAYARPDVSRVRIDATWGIPNSLLFCPHDTYEVDLQDPDRIHADVRWKGHFIDVDDEGMFEEREAGWNWDWKQAIAPAQVREIANIAHQIAYELDSRVQVMFFVDVARGSGYPKVLPWFIQADDDFDPAESSTDNLGARPTERTIRTTGDFSTFRADLDSGQLIAGEAMILLRPTADYLRNTGFLEEVGLLAASKRLPVLMEGSVLSHAYYVLRRAGASVREHRPGRRRAAPELPLNKLVRDQIPQMIIDRSEDITVREVSGEDLTQLLILKAVEEAFELAFATGEDATLEELADVLETIRSIAGQFDLSLEQLVELADEKRASRGAFETGRVLLSTRERTLGEPGEATEPRFAQHPGRIPPFVVSNESGTPVLRVPVRGIGLPMPIDVELSVLSYPELTAVIRYGPDAIDIALQPRQKEPRANQLSFDF